MFSSDPASILIPLLNTFPILPTVLNGPNHMMAIVSYSLLPTTELTIQSSVSISVTPSHHHDLHSLSPTIPLPVNVNLRKRARCVISIEYGTVAPMATSFFTPNAVRHASNLLEGGVPTSHTKRATPGLQSTPRQTHRTIKSLPAKLTPHSRSISRQDAARVFLTQ